MYQMRVLDRPKTQRMRNLTSNSYLLGFVVVCSELANEVEPFCPKVYEEYIKQFKKSQQIANFQFQFLFILLKQKSINGIIALHISVSIPEL